MGTVQPVVLGRDADDRHLRDVDDLGCVAGATYRLERFRVYMLRHPGQPLWALQLTRPLRDEVQFYLDERRLLGTRMEIAMPEYVPTSLEVRIKGKPGTDFNQVAAKIEKGLYRYVHPVSGGNDGNGWPFGRGITLPEIYAAIQQIGDIDFIREARIFRVNSQTGEREEITSEMGIPANGILCSSKHKVVVEE